jgi:hypothetical protein
MTVPIPDSKAAEVIPQEIVNNNIEKVQETEKPAEQKEATSEDPNWRAFREARKKDRAEKEAAERRAAEKEAEVAALKAAMEAAFSKSAPTPQAYQQYYGQQSYDEPEETEDQRIEKKVNALLAAREEQARREQQQREQQEYPNRIMRDFPDFNNVVSQENLDYIDYHYPEVSRPLQRLGDGYDKWHDIYKAIKKFVPNNQGAKKDAARAEANSMKPKSMSISQQTPSGEVVRSSLQELEAKRAANWARMQNQLKGVS